ncbi:hypothetical protein SAMN04487788_3172 [Microbacterium testaceum StLB037]|uniref:Uncharacterized protein n=2 Tax=Microbacterium testaceum TaxID=2033 RepID=A0A1H0S4T9_MICTS|nr:hypothetical protein SAMN04487788_3172 [Microbacterium testaceum StLB037]
MKASVVALASCQRWNPAWDRVFVTSEDPGVEWRAEFASVGARVEVIPFAHTPPVGFAPTFAGSLYLLDAVDQIALSDYLLLIDPDVLCVGDLSGLLREQGAIAALPLPYGDDHDINRLSRTEAARIHDALGEPRTSVSHYGGEFYGIPSSLRRAVIERAATAWRSALDRYERGLSYFTTEEHIMGFALEGLPTRASTDIVNRIWTAHRFRSVTGNEAALALWHLPAEKERAFAEMHAAVIDRGSWFWTLPQESFVERAGRVAGLHHRKPSRLLKDIAAQARHRIRRK